MIQYRLANAYDMDDLIDFINMVFSMLRVPHNFEKMLPKVYAEGFRLADAHVIAEEDGKLCGCLGMYVFPMRIGSKTLRVGYLGSMAVHPRVRGKGTMGELMRQQIARGHEMELDMMVLGGQRQRYQYSGFEACGATYTYSISRANVRHALSQTDSEFFSLRIMQKDDIEEAFALYNRQSVAGARTLDNFLASLQSYHRAAWTIEKDGNVIGYLCAAPDDQSIDELVLQDRTQILPIIKAWMEKKEIRLLHVAAAPYDTDLNCLLAPICENYSISPNCMLNVLRPETVLEAYMKLKNTNESLIPGEVVLDWEGKGRFLIRVTGQEISVKPTEKTPDLKLTNIDATQTIFGYNRFCAPDAKGYVPANWFPLPFHIPEPDSF